MIWHSFEPGVASFGLDGVLAAIGLQVFGTDFARLDPTQRRDVVLQLLTEQRLLLIWDNFEAVHSMPDPAGATPPLDEVGRDELRDFLSRVAAAGPSAVIITSRSEESWLGEVRRISVGGLTPEETIDYADQLLAPYPAANPRRAQRAFAELIDWLDGHPLSMRLILPQLDTTDPQTLLAGLRGITPLPCDDNGGRTTSLAASITYSFTHLSPDDQRLLVAVSLFQGVTDAQVLGVFSKSPQVPQRFRLCTKTDWAAVLNQTTAVGLLTALGGGMYGIHPALPAYLAQQWCCAEPDDYPQQRAAAEAALLDAYAAFGAWLHQQFTGGDAAFVFAVLDRQRRTLGTLLANALDTGLWDRALDIAQPLDAYWTARGLEGEARGWVDRARLALETANGIPPPVDDPAGALWLFFTGSQANRQLAAHHLDAAERSYLDIHDMLQAQPVSSEQLHWLTKTYHQLGMVAQERGRLEDAEQWYRHSLTISEEPNDRLGMASSFHQLGTVAQLRGRLEDAEHRYRQSLAIKKELSNRPGMNTSYHQLGMVAQGQGRLEDAEQWYRHSLTISEELNDRLGMASSYLQLGTVAQLRGRLEDAEQWYRHSLTISEELNDRLGMASSFHQLGTVAQLRGRLEDAEQWYRHSLTISEELGNRRSMALSFVYLGLLAKTRGRPEEALEWMVRCVTLFDEFPHPMTEPSPTILAQLIAELGIGALERCWQRVTGRPIPRAVQDFVGAGRRRWRWIRRK